MDRDNVNFSKGLAILAVVGIHTVNIYLGKNLWLINWDQLFRFSVPLFTALSGLALAKKYSTNINIKDFYLGRTTKLIPSYALWAFVYWLVSRQGFPFEYHLYFVPMIFQAYLLFPLILYLVKKFPWLTLGLSFILQIIVLQRLSVPMENNYYVWFSTWQFYFVLGVFLAFMDATKFKLLAALGVIVGFLWSVKDVHNLLETGKNLIWATRFTRFSVLTFSTFTIIYMSSIKYTNKIINFLGKHSYLIYLSHVLFLKLFLANDFLISGLMSFVIGVAAILLSVYSPYF